MDNIPNIWVSSFPFPNEFSHKYSRGQAGILGGVEMSGAACLAIDSAARIGAGLSTIISPSSDDIVKASGVVDPLLVYKTYKPYIIARSDIGIIEYAIFAKEKGRVCIIIGSGLGNKNYKAVRSDILSLLELDIFLVIDADGINAFENHHDLLFSKLNSNVVLTPHEGEFKKLFPSLIEDLNENRVIAAQKASEMSGAVIVLKGHETVIAQADREAVISNNASPYLATAGSGDVLAGMISGLIAQGMEPFLGACAGVWIHGKASSNIGAGLVASDLVENIPNLLKEILGIHKKVG